MRDLQTIDAELRLMSVVRRAIEAEGEGPPSTEVVDRLLDERIQVVELRF